MKWLLISLAIGLVASDKLDRTYLPPPGAHSSGGDLGSHDAPLEPPNHSFSEQGPVLGGKGAQSNFGINRKPVNFGDKILKVPVTTTSYAFSQTTTYPPGESFETTAFPINPVTGLPIGLEEGNFSFGSIPGQAPNSGTNIQSGFVPQGPTSVSISNGSPGYDQYASQPLSQYPGENVITRVGAPQVSESVHPGQNLDQLQYTAGEQVSSEQQVFQPTGAGQNRIIPGGVAQFSGDQRLVQYSDSQKVTGQQGFVPSTGSLKNLQPAGNEQGVSYDGSQGTYTGQPINVQLLDGTQPTQPSYQNQDHNIGRIPSQFQNGNQNSETSVPTGSVNVYQPGTTTSTVPSSYDNSVSSTTPFPAVPSTNSAYSSVGPVYGPERPQAAADRNAVILNYENIRTPNGYSYSYDTSNGIHADENGIVDNGTKAQGSYSYIGDDGKLYSVIYTADENGFLPRGDHLPTPPPIPEAIQKIIEQAAKDKAAGIIHDGSYDEAKYGDHLYQRNKHRRPQNQDTNQFGNNQYNGANYDPIKPNVKDGDYAEGVEMHQFNKNIPITGTRKNLNGIILSETPTNQRNSESYVQNVSEGNENVSGHFDSPKEDFAENSMLIIEKGLNHLNNYGTKKQRPGERHPVLNKHNLPYGEAKDSNQNNQTYLGNYGPSTRRPISSNINGITETKYPGTNVNIGAADYYKGDGFNNNENQDNIGSPNVFNGLENTKTNFDKVTGSPVIENKQQILKQTVSGNKTPSSTGNRYNQNKYGGPQSESFPDKSTKTPPFSDYVKNHIANQQETKQDDTRYQYPQPNTNFDQNKFPTRFGPQEASSIQPDQPRNEYVEGTTRKPFITPNIYNQNNKNKEATSNKYNQNDINRQSTTRRPFTTISVTSPTDNSYTDYDDDDDDYATNQDISGDRTSSTKKPTTSVTSRPYQPTKTTSRTQNMPSSQKTRVIQKGSLAPGRRIETSETITPGYTYGPTTQMPSHNSRFGGNEFPRRMKPQQRKPANTDHGSVTAVGRPIPTQPPSGTRHLGYRYQTTGPNSRYPGENAGSAYPTTVSYPGLGTVATTSRFSTPQDYHTTTYGPSQGYSSMTAVPPTSGYTHGSGSQASFRTPESLQPSQDQSFYTGYHYGPPKSGSLNTGVFPTSLTGTYQTTYQQGPDGFPSTTLGPITPGSQGTYNTPHPGTFATMTSPTGTYQYNGSSTPGYATTIGPGGKPEFIYSESPGLQDTTGFKYGSSRPTFSTTESPSTLATTPGSSISSGTTGPSQDYSSTHPNLQITQDKFVGGPVDGFGRPIMIDQGGFRYPTQGTTGPGINIGPNNSGTDHDHSTSYPGRFDQTRVIGEDFSGPKQPQRYDPVTGYHYK